MDRRAGDLRREEAAFFRKISAEPWPTFGLTFLAEVAAEHSGTKRQGISSPRKRQTTRSGTGLKHLIFVHSRPV
jgi:hypothetical protein